MGLFSNGPDDKGTATRQAETDKDRAQRAGRNNVTVAELQCRSTKQTGRPIFAAVYRKNT
jgi:hypothetical protein